MAALSNDDITPHLEMREYWHTTFEQIFKSFSQDEWKLEPTKDVMPQEWRRYKDGAKVKFVCDCGHSWTSMRGIIIFWFKKIGERERREEEEEDDEGDEEGGGGGGGEYSLRFKLYGQQCQSCNNEEFHNPRWYKEEVDKVLNNVYQKIGEAFYEFPSTATDDGIRHGRPQRPHDSSRCQACREGQCRNNRGR